MDTLPETIGVIGGGGFLGTHLITQFLEEASVKNIIVIDYAPPRFEILKHERITYHDGINILEDDYSHLIEEAELVYYLVAIMRFGYRNKLDLFQINGDAVATNLKIFEKAGIKQLVFISSIATVASHPSGKVKGTEQDAVDWETKQYAYYGYSKQLGEDIVKKAIAKNTIDKISIACPGILLGTLDRKMDPMYKMAEKMPVLMSPPGGTNYVDVRDVASGLIAVGKRGEHGGKYLLTNNENNIRHGELLRAMGKSYGKDRKILYLPRFLGPLVWNLMRPLELFQPKSSKATKEGTQKSFIHRYFDNSWTMESLDWQPKYSLDETLQDVVTWQQKS